MGIATIRQQNAMVAIFMLVPPRENIPLEAERRKRSGPNPLVAVRIRAISRCPLPTHCGHRQVAASGSGNPKTCIERLGLGAVVEGNVVERPTLATDPANSARATSHFCVRIVSGVRDQLRATDFPVGKPAACRQKRNSDEDQYGKPSWLLVGHQISLPV